MNADQAKAKSIFLNAAEMESASERDAYIASACGDNRELRDEVAGLLKHHAKAGQFLDGVAVDVDVTANQPAAERIGQSIGPYKLLQQIGEGGMGTVYMAEQSKPIQRKVAIKVIKPGMDSAQVIARFEAERQALALMDHVNIARVFDGGTTASGRPYFVMELVHGVPITKYCDDNHLTPRERLDLFVPVCQAIQHAHQKGIIHRDIKPSNVMVTLYDGKPVPKVIDFGVAKATEQKLTERTLFTQYGTLVGTLEYMSPEQAEMSALGVDTRSDIYSLGVLLYELLTGTTPIGRKRMKEAAYGEILRLIKEEDPPRPSTRLSESGEALASISALRHTEPAKLTKLVRGELDWIVMKCLEKDRNRRYETANGFAADLQRHLADETVQACPPSLAYRFQKFTRKYRKLLVTSGIIAVLLVAATAISAWQWREAAVQRNLAQNKTAEAAKNLHAARKSVDDWFTTISQTTLLDAPGLQPLRKQLLESALVYYQGLSKQAADDLELRADLAAAHMRMSLILVSLDRNDDAIAAIFEGIEIVEQLLKERPDDTEFPKRLAGFFRTPRQLYQRTRPPADAAKAAKTLERAAEIWERFARTFPEISEFRGDLAGIHALLGALTQGPDPKRSLAHARRSREFLEELVRSTPSEATYNDLLVHAYSEITYSLERAGSQKESQQMGADSIRFFEELSQQFPKERGPRFRLATVQTHFAGRIRTARPDEAEALYRKSIAILENLTAEAPTNSQIRRELYHTYQTLSGALRHRHREVEADEMAAKSQAVNEKLVLEFPDMPEFRQALASRYSTQANRLAAAQPAEAILALRQALDIHEKLVADFPNDSRYFQDLEKVQSQLIALFQSNEQYQQLEQIWRRSIGRYEKLAEARSLSRESKVDLARCHNRLGLLLRSTGKVAEAEIELRKAQRQWAELADAELTSLRSAAEANAKKGDLWGRLAIAHYRYGQWDEALTIYREKGHLGYGIGGSAWQWFHIAMAHWQLGQEDDALAFFYQSMEWVENAMEKRLFALQSEAATLMQLPDLANRPEQGWNHFRIAKEHESKGEKNPAIAAYGKAADFYESLYIQYPPVRVYRKKLVNALKAIGKSSEIGRVDQEAMAALEKSAETHPSSSFFREALGRHLHDAGQLDRAELEFTKAIEIKPGSWEAWHGRGLARGYKRQWELAIADYTESIRLSPDQHPNWWHRGHANLALKQWDAAADDFSGFVERWGDVGEAWYLRAIANAQRNQADTAMADLRKSRSLKFALAERLRDERRLDPLRDREDFRELFAEVLLLTQTKFSRPEQGHEFVIRTLEWFEKVKDERLLGRLSETATALGLPDPKPLCESAWKSAKAATELEARKGGDPRQVADAWVTSQECCEKLFIAFPAVSSYRRNLVAVLEKTSRSSEMKRIDREALPNLEKLAAAVPKCIEYRFALGKLYHSLGEKEKAEAEFAAAIEQAPKSWVTWDGRAFFRFQCQQWEGAIADFTEAAKLAPMVHSIWWHRAHSYLNSSQWDKAAADFTTVLDGWPRSGEGLVLRGIALAQLKQPDKAVADIRDAIELGFTNVGWLKSDARLDPLREREDFGKLLQELERKERPAKENK